jgi:hypothetical protein
VTLYRFLLGLALATAAIFGWFFLEGLADGTVSSFNIGLWLAILGVLALVIGGGVGLRRGGRTRQATLLLSLIAVPAGLAGVFFLVLILTVDRWN